ncbi:hypothetical protein BXZ70DRAFT_944805 [Cristinia sonorae]|uniref:WDR59/RTC1-like RING zinc finger domain-containing protein n=1 Tax=Cristinia sonorae TaxID=1940300 RepID=A0A8K0XNC0_9AGAR|nr:hypothetical protein BXZ70DRAFT_944805 [Cristinia sonorae]
MSSHRQRAISEEPSSPEDGSNFRRSLQIDMKGLVGSAVGNMSISPWSRDVVLAARKGLFIIDLEAPLNVPRFLPQGGTWDVADVQWNPHMSRIEYIVSTSSEKLLIWNLYLAGKTSIEFILRSHYRAITDINWHTFDPDVVVSTGIDSWLWAWDLRTTRKPVLGLCAFNAGGTQVKWNRQDGNILASSHANEVLIWDRRKGSLPTSRINAHGAKIYGIDWSHDNRSEIVTCSLDKTIKVWDIHQSPDENGEKTPLTSIQTAYPVWRARNLPFGQGVLSLPQRGETALEMWVPDSPQEPIERFEGHSDVVKEFVWRKGGQDEGDFQLITWSKDKTLRFWPIDSEIMQKAGKITGDNTPNAQHTPMQSDSIISFSNPPLGSDLPPALSAPVGLRGILAEVRASQISRPPVIRPSIPSHEVQSSVHDNEAPVPGQSTTSSGHDKGVAPGRGYVGGRSAQITTFAWLSSVKVGKREDSSGPGSGGESATASRMQSRSRPPSISVDPAFAGVVDFRRTVLDGRERAEDDHRDVDSNQSLQEEITSVVNKLTSSKVRLEKADLTKKRTCTFGLHGPWGEATSVFIRISFTFPKDYPQASHPGGTPQVDLERNPLISMKSRVLILRRLRIIRETHRPCLEACLRFLLFGDDEDELMGPRPMMDSGSSSEDEDYPIIRKYRDRGTSLLRGDKNLAEPRTSQGVFAMNGQLVCFFRAPPRIVRNVMRDLSASPSIGSRGPDAPPRLFRSPGLLTDAVRRLSLAANDRDVDYPDTKKTEDANSILRIMSNLYSFSHQKVRKFSENSRPSEDVPNNYSLLPTRRSTVFIKDASSVLGLDIESAAEYVFPATHPHDWCARNAEIARHTGRIYHQRIFTMLQVMILDGTSKEDGEKERPELTPLMMKVVEKLYTELLSNRDMQMLAMMAIMLFDLTSGEVSIESNPLAELPLLTPSSPLASLDYFSIARRLNSHKETPSLPPWSHHSPSPTPQSAAPTLSSPSSSRGSWSSLFTTSNMRRLMSGMQKEEEPIHRPPRPQPASGQRSPHSSMPSQFSAVRMNRKSSPLSVQQGSSWSDVSTPAKSVSFTSAGFMSKATFSQVVSADRKRVVFEADPRFDMHRKQFFALEPLLRAQMICHILAYADMLSAWQLPQKRAELLKSVDKDAPSGIPPSIISAVFDSAPLGVIRTCKRCGLNNQLGIDTCVSCGARLSGERCTVCRLPVRGLARTCLLCLHDTHVKCWEQRLAASHRALFRPQWCASGCGCECSPAERIAYTPAHLPSPLDPEAYIPVLNPPFP